MSLGTDPKLQTDDQLAADAGRGSYAAFQELVSRFQARVFAVARRITGQQQDAEDVTQQTFLSLIESIDRFRGESSVATWILRIATNHALKILRKRRGLPTVSLDAPVGGDGGDSYATLPHPDYIAQWNDTPDRIVQQAEHRAMIDAALAELDEKYRLVFILRDIEELSVRETAEALGLSEGNVRVRLLRARLMLREQLTRQFGDESTRMIPNHDHE